MPYVVDESTQYALISIFTVLLPFYERTQPNNNLIINEFLDKELVYKEKLLYLTIRGSMYRLDKSMQSIWVLMTNPKTACKFFSLNDYGLIVDCCLRELESPNTSRTRIQILKVMCVILDHPAFIAHNKHRLSDFNTKLENLVIHEDASQEFVVKEREQIIRVNMRLMKLANKRL
jgi:hypothetical protein